MADSDTGLMAVPRVDGPGGLEQLVERYGDRVYRLALRITGVSAEAEEIAAATLLTAGDTMSAFADLAALESWLYRAAARAAHERRTRHQLVDAAVLDDVVPALNADGHFEPIVDWSRRVDEPGLRDSLTRAFAEAIDELPADYRTALILHDVEGASKAEIAEILTVEVPAVSSRVHRARMFVRKRLSRQFEAANFTSSRT